MSFFQIREIETVLEGDVLLACAELLAFVKGEFGICDLPLDDDLVTSSYTRSQPREEQADLLEEPQFALQAAKETIETLILEVANLHSDQLGNHYPFEISPRAGVLLSRKPNVNADLHCLLYLSMQIHLLNVEDLLEFGATPNGRDENPHLDFTQPFEKLFEVIAGIAVTNEVGGIGVLLSESRGIVSLVGGLQEICRIAGTGAPKDTALLNTTQRRSNDGGIDAVVLRMHNSALHETKLVGATIQRANLRVKMVDSVVIDRFRNFLTDSTALGPYTGCFAHPMTYDIGRRELCVESNCSYYHKGLILQNLRPLEARTIAARRSRAAIMRAASKQLRKLGVLVVRIDFDEITLEEATEGARLI